MKTKDFLRKIPSVDKLLLQESAAPLREEFGREPLALAVRETLNELRDQLREGLSDHEAHRRIDPASILESVREQLEAKRAPQLCRVINATGVILHTGLGRAVLPEAARRAIQSEQRGYSLLELDRKSGGRGTRETFVEKLLQEVTGAEAATVVNNNAGATLLTLATLARGKEVIASRGQLVEIGGSFRIPDVMEQSGATLVEVGTTNRTYIADYEKGISTNTGLLLRVHTSNYRVVGFTHSPTLEELVALGKEHSIPVMDDIGSGAMIDLSRWGLSGEPTPQESLSTGADVVCFSGDKLLGGPQAGIIVGKDTWVRKIRRNPLFRAFRPDKLTLTALEATLKLFRDPDRLLAQNPTLHMITMDADEIERRALDLAGRLQKIAALSVEILDDRSEVGGGSAPAQTLPTKVVAVHHESLSLEALSERLRLGTPSILARIQRERILFDVRTLLDGDADDITNALFLVP